MSKLRLTIEDLSVESFATCAPEGGLGTVHANAKTVDTCGETVYGNGACSADDNCYSAPHAYTPCAGCVETADPTLCLIDGGELG